jgi:hypothetical protein
MGICMIYSLSALYGEACPNGLLHLLPYIYLQLQMGGAHAHNRDICSVSSTADRPHGYIRPEVTLYRPTRRHNTNAYTHDRKICSGMDTIQEHLLLLSREGMTTSLKLHIQLDACTLLVHRSGHSWTIIHQEIVHLHL